MSKKRSLAVTIFGWCQILVGAVGSVPSLAALWQYALIQYRKTTNYYGPPSFPVDFSGFGDDLGLDIAQSLSRYTFALIFVLFSGILTLRLNSSAKRINIFLLPALLTLEAIYVVLSGEGWGVISCDTIARVFFSISVASVFLGIALLQVWFFTRPKIKKQFE